MNLRLVVALHSGGLRLLAWSANSLDEQEAMMCLGVDGIVTSRPDILLTYLRLKGGR